MQTMCESGYIGASKHSLGSTNESSPSKQPRTSKHPNNDVISSGKIHYLGPNKMILTYYETENADPALEDHFKRSLSASGPELKAAYAEQQRTRKVPASFWTRASKPHPQGFSTIPISSSAPYHSAPIPSSYPYQMPRYSQGRHFPSEPPPSPSYGSFLKPAPPPLNLYSSNPSGQHMGTGGPGRYGPSHALPSVANVSHIQHPASGSYGSFFPGSTSRMSGSSYVGQQSRGSDGWVVPPPLGGPFSSPTNVDFGNPGPHGFGSGILPPPAYGTFAPGEAGPSVSQDSFLTSSSWTSFI